MNGTVCIPNHKIRPRGMVSPITGACAAESPDGFLTGKGLWLAGLPRLEASKIKDLNTRL